MHEYKFVEIKLSSWNNKPTEDYREIIKKHAKDGWRFVQIFAPAIKGYGSAAYFEIIFERPLNE
ncbi:DUF4177 domain-containing protein [Bacillus sp. FJAT-50079]|uniref:DUF4177 domain-containing protein n=1 Tax=Bacillus sp. FJAT-50079 TaxID=2833577 RepID=UPI001BC903C9|nr:DUF4177 domain-containing protein [Bacillus sp. FJAT-50079]MBS4207340.1 DUF4177 domain-containing protein [Bacillus sp. FJAT-50079]